MTKKQTQKYLIINLLPAMLIVVVLFFGFSSHSTLANNKAVTATIKAIPNDTLKVVDELPQFSRGNLQQWIAENIKYPIEAMEMGIEGTVSIQFIIEKDGTVSHPEIVQGLDSLLNNEALRIINLMPRWKPAKLKGKAVRVSHILPINFVLTTPEMPLEPINDDTPENVFDAAVLVSYTQLISFKLNN